jgi:hypothetical protein
MATRPAKVWFTYVQDMIYYYTQGKTDECMNY